MKTHTIVFALVVSACSAIFLDTAAAQSYDPVPGGEVLDRLRSPLFLAGTENTASTESISGDVINPATSALKQRVHLDTSYAAIVGDGKLDGHAVNLGVSVPTRFGVFTGSGNYAQADYDALNIGQRGSVNFSFAKDLYPQLLFGAGLRGHFGSNGGSSGFGAGADLGIIHIIGPLAGLPEVRWGFAITQLGIGYKPVEDTTGSPSPFTPAADIEATVIDSDDVDWRIHTGFSAPSFQNVRYRAGTALSFFDRIDINVGWDIDLVEQTDSDRDADSLLPSVGITVRFQTDIARNEGVISDQGWNQSDIAVHSAWAPLYDDVWAAGAGVQAALGVIDREPPEVEITYPERQYLSPNNDGASDELLLPVEISDQRYVTSWSLDIVDESGETIRTIENKEQRPENAGFQNIVDRLLYVKKGVTIPDEIRWDGRTDNGGLAPDGAYRFSVTAVDDNGNTTIGPEQEIVLDSTPPDATIDEPEETDGLVFSPNDDGRKDVITLETTSSTEDSWSIEVLDATDSVVYTDTVADGSVTEITWDGRDNEGILVPDGVYSVRVSAIDRAQNETTTRLNNIIVDTEPTPIALTVDISHFSPNGDGRRDTVTFTPEIPVTEGIRSHEIVLRNAAGTEVRRASGGETIPEMWEFDGSDESGARLPEGTYTAELIVLYRNGNRPTATAPELVLDVTAPRVSVRANSPVFSPNGDGNLDEVVFLQSTDTAPEWRSSIVTESTDERVREFRWTETPSESLPWDGRDESGNAIPDGRYRYQLEGEDRAGNIGVSTPVIVDLDTRETPIFVFPSQQDQSVSISDDNTSQGGTESFSPNNDGVQDTIYIISELVDPIGAERFEMEILDRNDELVARLSGTGAPERSYPWDGRDRSGSIAADGTYRVRLSVFYRHGNRPTAISAPFVIDTVHPDAAVTVADASRVFSPDGDNDKDTIVIDQRSSSESMWTAQIVRSRDGTPVRTWRVSGELEPIEWDGTDNDGEVVPDDTYRYEVIGVDEAGNRTTVATQPFRTDTRDIELALRISEPAFSPNNDGILDTVTIAPEANIDLTVSDWTVRIYPVSTEEGGTQRATGGRISDGAEAIFVRSGEGALQSIEWDGRDTNGRRVPDGRYRGEITAQPIQREEAIVALSARSVLVDTVAPTVEVELSSDVISPNGDGRLDQLEISQVTSSEVEWTATIRNEAGREVGRWEWVGTAPEQLRFAGLDTSRRRVADGEYTYEITATDTAGNTGGSGQRQFEIYTAETPLQFFAQYDAFSPNNDGVRDTVPFAMDIALPDDADSWRLDIKTADNDTASVGQSVFSRDGTGGTIPTELSWNGRGTDRQRAAEGTYTATLTVTYRHGNVASVTTAPLTLDVTAPELTVQPSFTVFSPDRDGDRDAIRLAQTSDLAQGWTGTISNDAGETVRSYAWNREATSFDWDGTDSAGNTVDDGTYNYVVQGTDSAGNTTVRRVPEIKIDTRPTRLYVTQSARRFSPNGDGTSDTIDIGLITSRTDGAESGVLQIVAADGEVVRQFEYDEITSRRSVTWDGSGERNTVADGTYTLRYTVRYDNGARPVAEAPPLTVDTTGPQLNVDLDGLPFSPDNDGLNDDLGITLSTIDATAIASWSFAILDRGDRPFYRFAGSGEPRRRLVWDGRSSDGDLVISAEDYPYRFTATDVVGNTREIRGTIPIDILVIRDGDRLKVQISNINFEPNSPNLQLNPTTPEGRKNVAVLDRLVEVFDKYRSYEIRVEGHAVNVTQTEREEREELQPLSTARAETVRNALIERGMSGARISTVGRGGTEPIVPHTDLENRWKNRRVEFILIR
jgi:flagellar hook assembly protein FlgD/outer membrane protein OmpA-like peptidoglycan-associated protein